MNVADGELVVLCESVIVEDVEDETDELCEIVALGTV